MHIQKIHINKINHTMDNILIEGSIKKIRNLKNIYFIIVSDISGEIQCVVDKNKFKNLNITESSSVRIIGDVINTNNQEIGLEIHVNEIDILSLSESTPIEIDKIDILNTDIFFDNRYLTHRNPKTQKIFILKSAIVSSFQEKLKEKGFIQIFTPKIVGEGAEGGSNIFSLDYFGQNAYLAQSPQFYKQMMVCSGYEKVYEVAPVFRAEKHNTNRHLNEYTSLDLEMSFISNFRDLIDLEKEIIEYIFSYLMNYHNKDLEYLGIQLKKPKFSQITFIEAKKILVNQFNVQDNNSDISTEEERLIGQYFQEKEDADFVFIINYPASKRPMYTKKSKNTNYTESYDLIYKGVEITSGGQRINEYKELEKSFSEKGISINKFQSYSEIFKYGAPPHGGFAIGLERFLSLILNLKNIKEASAYPRDMGRIRP
ncbi:aspartate--tRNA(Asn) ligase (plasmid) [Macrococcus psychrotolerans]|uniref:Aspartate--tRNA ligase n=1 Tax=Macrococcus psychrotolerans TaxID=3039389 RepID=A0AAT9PAF9_9STAP|nr:MULTISPECIES: aspartate--tRNA(Asn) ligase [Macrococcus]QYA34025.1 aspartate--tRNA(Asn) ligase [Macrococcus sp. 19Msa1099]QYA38809.1 aspartate--tRNA(Asn) ligase [Macrococcus caseolyticus]QYA77533.1 aspartate--tRNA(Asn) ligase [Macrococcus caseolyticus]